MASYLIKISSVLVLFASFLVYRSRLLSLPAFTTLKKHQGSRQGLAYNRCLQTLDYVFCLSRLRKKNYIEFIIFKKRYRSLRERHAEKASLFILCLWLFVQFYYGNLHDLFLIPQYMTQVILFLYQKLALFILKVVLFPFVYGGYLLCKCICYNKCRCKGQREGQTDDETFSGQV